MTLSPAQFGDLEDYMGELGTRAREASRRMALASPAAKRTALLAIADGLEARADNILAANARDVAGAEDRNLTDAMVDRLRLDEDRIAGMATGVRAIADAAEPVGQVQDEWTRPNGLTFQKVATPLGVIGMIYESRPNVTVDAAALCVKSGNAVILRGGSEAVHSNRVLHDVIADGLRHGDLPEAAVQLVGTQDRDAVGLLLGGLAGAVDLIIPRGGKGLVERVQRDARVPVLAHLDGLNTTYVHESADLGMALRVIENAKMRRTGVCGATETVLVDRSVADAVIPDLVARLSALGCEVRGDAAALKIAGGVVRATADDFHTEHLAPVLNLAVVDGLDDALAHIAAHGSGHTDAIIATDMDAVRRFQAEVDSAIVLHNASTQFADGGEFGFGAEIGIATGRLHARGPVGAQHLTSHKYLVSGHGTVRP